MSKHFMLTVFLVVAISSGSAGEDKALERLTLTTDGLIAMGETMLGSPASGMLTLGDTLLVEVNLTPEYVYSFIIWTESAFNFVDFWLTSPLGTTPRGDVSDHTTIAIIPDSAETGTWQLGMELLEGAYSDTCYFAAAIFRSERTIQP